MSYGALPAIPRASGYVYVQHARIILCGLFCVAKGLCSAFLLLAAKPQCTAPCALPGLL